MEIDGAKQILKKHLTKERFEHSLRVAAVAKDLADIYHVNSYDATIAALFHDIAKNQTQAELRSNIKQFHLPQNLLKEHHELWHGPVGAEMVKYMYHITDEHIYKAIYHHTTGRAHMSDLELIIYIADYIEPKRAQPGVDSVRRLAEIDLVETALVISSRTIKYLLDKRATIHIDTFFAYHDLLNRLK